MKTKKILSLVLCLLMLFSTMSLSASAVIEAWDWDVLVPGDKEKTHFDYIYAANVSADSIVDGGTIESKSYYSKKFMTNTISVHWKFILTMLLSQTLLPQANILPIGKAHIRVWITSINSKTMIL